MSVDWVGWAVFGPVATGLLTAVLVGAQLAGRTRLDMPLLLGLFVVDDPDRARAAGLFGHLVAGQVFALGYAVAFAAADGATWWLGALLGLLHGFVSLGVVLPLLPGMHPRLASERAGPSTAATLEPPGLLGLNYGAPTPVVALAAHVAFGALLGVLLR